MEEDKLSAMKQELLKREILDKNYDKEKFVDFCMSLKDNGDDLNFWEFEELEEVIKKFHNFNLAGETIIEKLEEIKVDPQVLVENIEISV
jgi:hypothetical protein